jgi:DNA-binding GntR family transcriptional regulator
VSASSQNIFFLTKKFISLQLASPTRSIAVTQLQRVYLRLRREILACRLAPGAKLNIASLAQEHGVSPGAVREALAMLEKEWFVHIEPQKGYSVRPVSADDLLDLTLARIEIERACLASSLAQGDIEWESQLVAAFHRTSRTAREAVALTHGDPAWIAAHDGFHNALVAACRSQRLLATRALLYDQSERYRQLSLSFSVERDVESEHRLLRDAALARDIPRTQDLAEAHIRATAEALIDDNF